jgi:hypothetical protein
MADDSRVPRPLDTSRSSRHLHRTADSYTRQRIVLGILRHDLHHGGNLFLTLGMHGPPPQDV